MTPTRPRVESPFARRDPDRVWRFRIKPGQERVRGALGHLRKPAGLLGLGG
jgi:hypothetical protein